MKKYLSLIKFSHTIFAMPFAFIGFFLATRAMGEGIDWMKFLYVILCIVFSFNAIKIPKNSNFKENKDLINNIYLKKKKKICFDYKFFYISSFLFFIVLSFFDCSKDFFYLYFRLDV